MDLSKIVKYLGTGVAVGAVLFFAGFGIVNMLNGPQIQAPLQPPEVVEPVTTTEITPPVIEMKPTAPTELTQNGEGTSASPIKIKPLSSEAVTSPDSVTQETSEAVAFGTLTLSTVHAKSGQAIPANFMIENSDSVAIALVKDTARSTLSLPAGNYKITVGFGQHKVVRFLGVKEGQNGSEVFELDVPVGEIPPVPELAGETEKSESEKTSDKAVTGALKVSALTKVGRRPIKAHFYIQRLSGENVKTVSNVTSKQFSLPVAKYRITAKRGSVRMVKDVTVSAQRGQHIVFHIPEPEKASETPAPEPKVVEKAPKEKEPAPSVKTETQTATAVTTPATPAPEPASDAESGMGQLELFSQLAGSNATVKSNFYVQTMTGKLVANKTYVDSIGYKLPTGKYRVTVRATGYQDQSVVMTVRKGQTRREVFKMQSVAPAAPVVEPVAAPVSVAPVVAPVAQRDPEVAPRGGLQVNIVSAQTGQGLIADISVHSPSGAEVSRSAQVSSARFDLPPSEFVVRVNYGGLITNQKVNIRTGKLAIKTMTFNHR